VFLLVVLVGCQQPAWKEFSSSEGAFSILMPGTPTEQIRTVKKLSGPVNVHMFLVEEGDVAYAVAYSDHPDTFVQERTPDLILDDVRDGAVANAHGKLVRESIVALNGHQGRELDIESAGGKVTIKNRIFLVGRRIYQVMAVTPRENTSPQDVNKFFESFALQSQYPKPRTQPAKPKA
jgi:hypothetical protein